MERKFQEDLEFAKAMDRRDPLKDFRARFHVKEDEIYMDGNSLGLSSRDAQQSIERVARDWKNEGIKMWGMEQGRYFNYPKLVGEKMRGMIGAEPNEIILNGSITTNLHQALATFYKPDKNRYKILVDELNFPTDIYAVKSLIELKGYALDDALVTVKSRDGREILEEDILEAMKEDVALILLPSVLYRSAQLINMEQITEEAHNRGIIIGWDLAHSIGAIPHNFKKIDPDFAVWCTYKYLNGGPGSVAGLYINRKHFEKEAGLKGWFGNRDDRQFLLEHRFEQAGDAGGWLQGSPHMLSIAPLEGSLTIFEEAGIQKIREKSLIITEFLMFLAEKRLLNLGYVIGNPRENHRRGGHVSLEHDEAYRISLALRDHGVVPDYREPNVIRLAPVALYNTYEEVYRLVETLEKIAKEKIFDKYSLERGTVL